MRSIYQGSCERQTLRAPLAILTYVRKLMQRVVSELCEQNHKQMLAIFLLRSEGKKSKKKRRGKQRRAQSENAASKI